MHVAWARSEALPETATSVLFDHGRQRADAMARSIRRLAIDLANGPHEVFVVRTRIGGSLSDLPMGWEIGLSSAMRLARDMGTSPLPRWAMIGDGSGTARLDTLPPDVKVFVLEKDGARPGDLAEWTDVTSGPWEELAPHVAARRHVTILVRDAAQVASCLARATRVAEPRPAPYRAASGAPFAPAVLAPVRS
jgi:hypothetical protein